MEVKTANLTKDQRLPLLSPDASLADWKRFLREFASSHRCSCHPLFARLSVCSPTGYRVAGLLRNYDAHASVLRRLLLKAVCLMPEEACCYILENVRNEYGNGDPDCRHQLQLLDLARQSGISQEQFKTQRIATGVKAFIAQVTPLYFPVKASLPTHFRPAAVAAGAITATELLAIKEFVHMQHFFRKLGLERHIWFNHIEVENEHSDESLALALHFIARYNAAGEVMFGLNAVLDANCLLYDGLLETLESDR
jgi:hypothetical protein